jgi:uncharacterized protein (DUF433 family)
MNWQERITVNPDVLVGKPTIKGTRISVECVVDLLGRGWTTEQILHEYDHLTRDDIQACLAYASELLKAERVYPLPS